MAIGRKCIAWGALAILVLAAGCARMSSSGANNCYASTAGYVRGTVK